MQWVSLRWGAEPPLPQASESEERSHYRAVMEAMQVIGFSAEELGSVRRILAAILHLVSLLPGLGTSTCCPVVALPRGAGEDWPLTVQPRSCPSSQLLGLWAPSRRPEPWAPCAQDAACELPGPCLVDEPTQQARASPPGGRAPWGPAGASDSQE